MLNYIQTPIESLGLENAPTEVADQFYDFVNNVPYIKALIAGDRKRAKDLPRDDQGRIIIDLTQPHILENMDYFRQPALTFRRIGKYTELQPNANPNSEYGKWLREEVRRCFYGLVRPEDGEWVTGDYYFFLNYCPMLVARRVGKKSRQAVRVIDFPDVWDLHYYKFHYLNMARENGHHAAELARRSAGKSFCGAAMLAKRFLLGESPKVDKKVTCYITASDRAKLVGGDQTLDKFQYDIDFCAEHTQFAARRLRSSIQEMIWQSGYIDLNTGVKKGTLNSVVGKSSANDASKLRGSRGVLYIFEECGTFPNLLELYNNLRPSVENGEDVFGMLYLFGTSGDAESDFAAAQEIMYNPKGYNVQEIKNVFDKEGQGRQYFTFFSPGYMNRPGCYDSNGNSDVTKAMLEILTDRYKIKYNSTDVNTITKRIAEIPITPQEALLRTRGNMFPITDLNARLSAIDNDPSFFDDVYTGTLVFNKAQEVEFKITADKPIRDFPLRENMIDGAIEIFSMPERDSSGKVFSERYIIGHDPVDSDGAETSSMSSTMVLDLWTDQLVAEYTGRRQYADENYEILRKLCLFYNARCLYENNLKGVYAYFMRMNCLYLLADTPEYLKDKEILKIKDTGNRVKGVTATAPVNNYGNTLVRDWLLKPVTTTEKSETGEEIEVSKPNLYRLRNRALLKELILYNPDINVDRVRSLGLTMLYREEYMIRYGGEPDRAKEQIEADYLGNDDFFTRNYDKRFGPNFNDPPSEDLTE